MARAEVFGAGIPAHTAQNWAFPQVEVSNEGLSRQVVEIKVSPFRSQITI
jgi:hypothetical protein